MPKHIHEIRDPIHVFVRLDSDERRVVNSLPFQRLRHIQQLATTYLVYPGATHKRFEHSLGVMELAGRVFDVVTHPYNIHDAVRQQIPELTDPKQLGYWRSCLRVAALSHDLGHLPFSHAAEKDLLPEGWDHERLSREIIVSPEIQALLKAMTPPLRADDVVKLALGKKKAKDLPFSAWETILAEIIVGDAFGVDRMDYLLRDSHHVGVPYGRFDHHRLIDTLRVLPAPPTGEKHADRSTGERQPQAADSGGIPPEAVAPPIVDEEPAHPAPADAAPADAAAEEPASPREPTLGIEEGGLHSAAALMIARFFMYTQLYFHPVRRAYDIHLKDFLKEWLEGGRFSTDTNRHLEMTDNEVTAAILAAARQSDLPGHDAAHRITHRGHFHELYRRSPDDVRINRDAGEAVFHAACHEFGAENFRHDRYSQSGGSPDFSVLTKDGRIASSLAMSETLTRLEAASFDFVFVNPTILSDARQWLLTNRQTIITPTEGQNDE